MHPYLCITCRTIEIGGIACDPGWQSVLCVCNMNSSCIGLVFGYSIALPNGINLAGTTDSLTDCILNLGVHVD